MINMLSQNLFLDSVDEVLRVAGHVELGLFLLVHGRRGVRVVVVVVVVVVGAIAIALHVKVFDVDVDRIGRIVVARSGAVRAAREVRAL